jgi:hypothetical protein
VEAGKQGKREFFNGAKRVEIAILIVNLNKSIEQVFVIFVIFSKNP